MDKLTIFLKTPGVWFCNSTTNVDTIVAQLENDGNMVYEITKEVGGYCVKYANGFYTEDELILRKVT